MLALKCIATCSYIALFFTMQCSSVPMWQMYAHAIHISSENALFSFSHSCPDQKDIAIILNGWIAEEHTFEMPWWSTCFCLNSTLTQPLGRVPLLVQEIQYKKIVVENHSPLFTCSFSFPFLLVGVIRTALPNMDREVKEQYQVLIQAKDMGGQLGGLAGTTTVNITLTDVNDNPPRFPKSMLYSKCTNFQTSMTLTIIWNTA